MRKITFSQATQEAMAETMAKDPTVFAMGEDLARQGGIFGQFKGLPQQFPGRIIDTPISETFIIGGGVGAALAGARPVVDMHFADFIGVPMDEIFNQMAKVRYMFGGQAKVPLVLRAPDGSAGGGAAQHSQCVESWFAHIPGIKVVAPSNPYDAKMVLKAAIECDDPVLYFENKILYKEKGEVPEIGEEEPYTLGKARVEREGKDVTIVSYSIGMKNARGAADLLAKEGIEAEVIDLITLSPWDKETVLNSVKKTHRLCIVHEAVKQGGFGAEISATVAEEAMEYLDAPILRYGAPFCPIPFAPTLEKMVTVVPEDLGKGIKGMLLCVLKRRFSSMATEVLMPKLGLTMTEGTIEEWKYKEGDAVKKGDILFSVATDKLTNDVELSLIHISEPTRPAAGGRDRPLQERDRLDRPARRGDSGCLRCRRARRGRACCSCRCAVRSLCRGSCRRPHGPCGPSRRCLRAGDSLRQEAGEGKGL